MSKVRGWPGHGRSWGDQGGLPGESEQRFRKNKEARQSSEGRAFQAEGAACADASRQEHIPCAPSLVSRPVCLDRGEQGGSSYETVGAEGGERGGVGVGHVEPSRLL